MPARLIAKATPGADSRFQLPATYSDVAVSTAAHAFLLEVEPVKAGFIVLSDRYFYSIIARDVVRDHDVHEGGASSRGCLRE